MQIKFETPKIRQSERTDQLSCSSSTLQRYRNDINMLSPYRIQSNITNKWSKKGLNTNFDKSLSPKHDLERPQMTSNDLVTPDTNTEAITKRTSIRRNKNILKAGSVQENVEIYDNYLDGILHKNNIKMELAMDNISNE